MFAGDIRDPNGVRTAMKGCDAVLHLAALIAIPYSYHSPDTYVETNIRGTLNVLQAARDFDVAHVVHTSTSEVYGTAQFVPITEEHPLQGQSPYSASKIGADQLALSFERSFGTPVTVVRPFNTYGPRQSARAVIPTIITQIAAGERTIKLGSVHPTRDFNFVADTVGGFIAALETKAGIGEVINIGSGFEISIGDTARLIAELMDAKIEIEQDDVRLRPGAQRSRPAVGQQRQGAEAARLVAALGRRRRASQGPRADDILVHQARKPVPLSRQRLQSVSLMSHSSAIADRRAELDVRCRARSGRYRCLRSATAPGGAARTAVRRARARTRARLHRYQLGVVGRQICHPVRADGRGRHRRPSCHRHRQRHRGASRRAAARGRPGKRRGDPAVDHVRRDRERGQPCRRHPAFRRFDLGHAGARSGRAAMRIWTQIAVRRNGETA